MRDRRHRNRVVLRDRHVARARCHSDRSKHVRLTQGDGSTRQARRAQVAHVDDARLRDRIRACVQGQVARVRDACNCNRVVLSDRHIACAGIHRDRTQHVGLTQGDIATRQVRRARCDSDRTRLRDVVHTGVQGQVARSACDACNRDDAVFAD